jgi:hypothetical protein
MLARVLILPDVYRYLLMCVDASGKGIGGVLMNEGRIVTYELRK